MILTDYDKVDKIIHVLLSSFAFDYFIVNTIIESVIPRTCDSGWMSCRMFGWIIRTISILAGLLCPPNRPSGMNDQRTVRTNRDR